MSPREVKRNKSVPLGQQSDGVNGGGFARASWSEAALDVGENMVAESIGNAPGPVPPKRAKQACSTGGNHSWKPYPAPAGPFCGRCGINKSTFNQGLPPEVGETVITEAVGTPFDLREGEGDYLEDVRDIGAIESVHVSRGVAADRDVYTVTAEHNADVYALVPSVIRDKEAWLDARQGLLVEFYRDRYSAELIVNESWDTTVAAFTVEHEGAVTVERAYEIAWKETLASLAFNESDPGTNGTENADRLFREFCDEHVISGVRGYAADDLAQEQIDEEVEARLGRDRELSDVTAVAIARDLGSDKLSELRKLGTLGYANRFQLRLDIVDAYQTSNRRIKNRLDMLGTWTINGGDNL